MSWLWHGPTSVPCYWSACLYAHLCCLSLLCWQLLNVGFYVQEIYIEVPNKCLSVWNCLLPALGLSSVLCSGSCVSLLCVPWGSGGVTMTGTVSKMRLGGHYFWKCGLSLLWQSSEQYRNFTSMRRLSLPKICTLSPRKICTLLCQLSMYFKPRKQGDSLLLLEKSSLHLLSPVNEWKSAVVLWKGLLILIPLWLQCSASSWSCSTSASCMCSIYLCDPFILVSRKAYSNWWHFVQIPPFCSRTCVVSWMAQDVLSWRNAVHKEEAFWVWSYGLSLIFLICALCCPPELATAS